MTIEPAFLAEVKQHLRILHNEDDDLIKNEITSATELILESFQLIHPDDDNYPATSDKLSAKQKLAIKHVVADYRMNPDGRIETRNKIVNKRLIERILGSERGY